MILDKIIREPKIETNNPIAIFLLHGYGSNKYDLFGFAEQLPDNAYVISFEAFNSTPFGGSSWYDLNMELNGIKFKYEDVIKAKEIIEQNIEIYSNELHLEKKDIFIIGFSQGAILSYLVGADNHEKINSIVAFSGYLLNEYKNEEHIKKLKNINVFISHGVYDEVIPVSFARATELALQQNEIDFFYREYEMPHGVSPECLDDAINWMNNNIIGS